MLDWHLKQIKEHADKLAALVQERDATIAKLKAETYGEIKQLAAYDYGVNQYDLKRRIGSPEAAELKCTQEMERCSEIAKQNAEAIKHNQAVLEQAISYMHGLGLKDRDADWGRNRRTPKWVTAAWLVSLRAQIPTTDRFSQAQSAHKGCMDAIEKWREEIEASARELERKKQKDEKLIALQRLIGELCSKYSWETDIDSECAMDSLLSRDKYLRLAHYMRLNRGDCSDGPDYTEEGLDGFTVETDEDKLIYAEISGLVSEWDGDGRCFRDCDWNYDRLFRMVKDENLLLDYGRLHDAIENVKWAY